MPTREGNRDKYIEELEDYKVIKLQIWNDGNELIKEIKYDNIKCEAAVDIEESINSKK